MPDRDSRPDNDHGIDALSYAAAQGGSFTVTAYAGGGGSNYAGGSGGGGSSATSPIVLEPLEPMFPAVQSALAMLRVRAADYIEMGRRHDVDHADDIGFALRHITRMTPSTLFRLLISSEAHIDIATRARVINVCFLRSYHISVRISEEEIVHANDPNFIVNTAAQRITDQFLHSIRSTIHTAVSYSLKRLLVAPRSASQIAQRWEGVRQFFTHGVDLTVGTLTPERDGAKPETTEEFAWLSRFRESVSIAHLTKGGEITARLLKTNMDMWSETQVMPNCVYRTYTDRVRKERYVLYHIDYPGSRNGATVGFSVNDEGISFDQIKAKGNGAVKDDCVVNFAKRQLGDLILKAKGDADESAKGCV